MTTMPKAAVPVGRPGPVPVGTRGPDFTLVDQNGAPVTLSELTRERNLLMVFYPFAFSGICGGELDEIRDDLGAFDSEAVHIVTISCDPVYSLRAWADQRGYFFPLLSDFWPHGEVARGYGVFNEQAGFASRGTFLVDRAGIVRWTLVNEPGERRDFSGFRLALAELN